MLCWFTCKAMHALLPGHGWQQRTRGRAQGGSVWPTLGLHLQRLPTVTACSPVQKKQHGGKRPARRGTTAATAAGSQRPIVAAQLRPRALRRARRVSERVSARPLRSRWLHGSCCHGRQASFCSRALPQWGQPCMLAPALPRPQPSPKCKPTIDGRFELVYAHQPHGADKGDEQQGAAVGRGRQRRLPRQQRRGGADHAGGESSVRGVRGGRHLAPAVRSQDVQLQR